MTFWARCSCAFNCYVLDEVVPLWVPLVAHASFAQKHRPGYP